MRCLTRTNDLPPTMWIALIVLGFVLFWPLGVAALIYLLWSGKMNCCIGKMASWKSENQRQYGASRGMPHSTGNVAFDEYRETTLNRLEEERREFTRFLEKLRRAKDQDEFDKFMSEQIVQPPNK